MIGRLLVGIIVGVCVGWSLRGLCRSAKLNDALSALGIAGVELDALRKERDALLHATRTQFRRKGDR
jgi:hypothetical protein